jgi:hypothetical protein
VSDDPIEPLAPPRSSQSTPIACLSCPSYNIEMQLTGIHPAPGGVYVHLACSNGHRQRVGIRSVDGRVLIEIDPSNQSMPARPGEIVH